MAKSGTTPRPRNPTHLRARGINNLGKFVILISTAIVILSIFAWQLKTSHIEESYQARQGHAEDPQNQTRRNPICIPGAGQSPFDLAVSESCTPVALETTPPNIVNPHLQAPSEDDFHLSNPSLSVRLDSDIYAWRAGELAAGLRLFSNFKECERPVVMLDKHLCEKIKSDSHQALERIEGLASQGHPEAAYLLMLMKSSPELTVNSQTLDRDLLQIALNGGYAPAHQLQSLISSN